MHNGGFSSTVFVCLFFFPFENEPKSNIFDDWWRWTKKKRTHTFFFSSENSGSSNSYFLIVPMGISEALIVLAQGMHRRTNHECETPDQHIMRLTWAVSFFCSFQGLLRLPGQMFLCVNRCYHTPIVSPNYHHCYQLPYEQIYWRRSHFIGCFGRRLVFTCAFGVSVNWWPFTDSSWPLRRSQVRACGQSTSQPTDAQMIPTLHIVHMRCIILTSLP